MSCYVGYWYLIWDVTPEIEGWIWKTFAQASRAGDFMQKMSSFLLFLVLTCNLCLDHRALLCLPTYWSGSLRRYSLKVVCVFGGMLMETWQVSLNWEHQVNNLVKSFAWGTGDNRKHVWCLDVVVKFKRLGGAKRWGGGRFWIHYMGMTSHKVDDRWSNLWLFLIIEFVYSSNFTIQGT